ncbi:unnamed protein product [Clonostachys byssicola]|uniref:Nitrogen starvation-induced glutamine rich protein n=1 Tax=Clonostachys byssicola TaxID=160290 RepID=A0A9N9UM99_9HYPO|nr:unnamed protein product [Clonostachys byssicola]
MSAQSYYGSSSNSSNYPQQAQYAQQPSQSSHYGQAQGAPYQQSYNAQAYQTHPQAHGQPEMMAGPDGERGLGATVVGGGAAGWTAHKAGAGMLGSLASAAAGAIGANFLENKLKKHRKDKKNKH